MRLRAVAPRPGLAEASAQRHAASEQRTRRGCAWSSHGGGRPTPGGAGDPGCLRRGPRKPVLGTTGQRQRENSWDELGLRRHHAAHAHPPPSGPARRAGRVAPPNFTDGEAEVRKGRHLPQLAEPVGPEPRSEPGRPRSWARTQRCLRRGASRVAWAGRRGVGGWQARRAGPGLGPSTAHPLPQPRWLCRSRGLRPPTWSSRRAPKGGTWGQGSGPNPPAGLCGARRSCQPFAP